MSRKIEVKPVAFITGARGFIGHHLIERFKGKYRLVLLFHSRPDPETIKNLPDGTCYYVGDLLDGTLMLRIFTENKIDLVLNFAGLATRIRCQDIQRAYQNNSQAVSQLISILARPEINTPKAVIIPSTKMIESPSDNNYALSKRLMEDYCMPLAHQLEVPILIVRLPNIYGPGDKNTERLIPTAILRAKKNQNLFFRADQRGRSRTVELLFVKDLADRLFHVCSEMMNCQWDLSVNPYIFMGVKAPIQLVMEIVSMIIGNNDVEILPNRDEGPPEYLVTKNPNINQVRHLVHTLKKTVDSYQ